MSNEKSTQSSHGIGFTGLLAIVFIVLKLTGVINWHWAWVLAPIWIYAVFVLVIVTVVLAVAWFKEG